MKQRAGVWGGLRSPRARFVRGPRKPLGEGMCAQRAAVLWQWDAPLFLPP